METFAQARQRLMRALESVGWTVALKSEVRLGDHETALVVGRGLDQDRISRRRGGQGGADRQMISGATRIDSECSRDPVRPNQNGEDERPSRTTKELKLPHLSLLEEKPLAPVCRAHGDKLHPHDKLVSYPVSPRDAGFV